VARTAASSSFATPLANRWRCESGALIRELDQGMRGWRSPLDAGDPRPARRAVRPWPPPSLTAATITGDDRDRRMTCKPSSRRRRLAIRQKRYDLAVEPRGASCRASQNAVSEAFAENLPPTRHPVAAKAARDHREPKASSRQPQVAHAVPITALNAW